jgi:hypothetical protein
VSITTVGELIEELENFDPEMRICIQMQGMHRIYAGVAALEGHEERDDILVILPGGEEYSAESIFV